MICRRLRGRALAVVVVIVAASVVSCGADDPSTSDPTAAPIESSSADPTTADVSTTDVPTTTAVPVTTQAPAATTTVPAQPDVPGAAEDLGLPAGCDAAGGCVSVRLGERGVLVSYDATAGTLTFHEATPRVVTLVPSVQENALYLAAVGPDDVAYLVAQQPEAGDPVGYVVAVSTDAANPGESVASADGVDLSGDSDLVGTPAGLVSVGCCGGERRPAADAPVLLGWVDHTGSPAVSDRPDVWIEYLGDGSATVHRTGPDGAAMQWSLDDASTRSMPVLAALDDGGVVIDLTDSFVSSLSRLVRLHPDGAIEVVSVAPATVLLAEPGGSVIVADGGALYRLRPFAT